MELNSLPVDLNDTHIKAKVCVKLNVHLQFLKKVTKVWHYLFVSHVFGVDTFTQ